MTTYQDRTDFLVKLGLGDLAHTEESYLSHLVALYRDLGDWGCAEPVRRAGMFHSIYGTRKFQGFTLPLARRGEVRALIGERAERLAYLNCALFRPSLDAAVLSGRPRGRRSNRRRRRSGWGRRNRKMGRPILQGSGDWPAKAAIASSLRMPRYSRTSSIAPAKG